MNLSSYGDHPYRNRDRFSAGIIGAWICAALFLLQIFLLIGYTSDFSRYNVVMLCAQFIAALLLFRCGYQPQKSMMRRKSTVYLVVIFCILAVFAAFDVYTQLSIIRILVVGSSGFNFETVAVLTDLISLYFYVVIIVALILFVIGRYGGARIFAFIAAGFAALKVVIQEYDLKTMIKAYGWPDGLFISNRYSPSGLIYFVSMLIYTIIFIVYISRFPMVFHAGYAKQNNVRAYEAPKNMYSGTSSVSSSISAPASAMRDRNIIKIAAISLFVVAIACVLVASYYRSHFGVYELTEYDVSRNEAFTSDIPIDLVSVEDGVDGTIKMSGRDFTVTFEGIGKGSDGMTYIVAEVSNNTHSTVGIYFKSTSVDGMSVPVDSMTYIAEPETTTRIKIGFDELYISANRIKKIHEADIGVRYIVGYKLNTYIHNADIYKITFAQDAERGEQRKDLENVSDDAMNVYFQGVMPDADYNNRVNLIFYLESKSDETLYLDTATTEPANPEGYSYSDTFSLEKGESSVMAVRYYLPESYPEMITVTIPYTWYDSNADKHESSLTLQIDASREFTD